ncbi:retroviral-like aspartic protease family protein [Usitatibacter palustris]|nr:retroviral-like aspartic protease family protein [Usitatibacter palustris]
MGKTAALAIWACLLLAAGGCTTTPRVGLEIAPAPAPLIRPFSGFWEAVLALDFDQAEALVASGPERDYLVAVRMVADGRVDAAQDALSRLIARHDREASPRARALLQSVVKETTSIPDNAFASRVDRSFAEALHEAKAREQRHYPEAPVSLPFERNASTTPMVAASVNGVPTMMGIDTGAGLTVIGSELANAVGAWRLGARIGARDAHGEGVHVELAVVDLQIGGIRLVRHPVMVIDSARLRFRVTGLDVAKFDGVLGWNALSSLRVVIDNASQTVQFGPSSAAAGRGNLFWVGEPYVRAQASNGFPLTLFLDTGASRSAIATPLAAGAGLRDGVTREAMVMAAGSSRKMAITVHRDGALHVGGARIKFDELQTIAPRELGYAVRDGILGADALLAGRVTIDFGAREFSVVTAR